MFLHTIDDYAMVALTIIALLLYGTMTEMGEAMDFGDEILLLLAFVLTIASWFA